MKRKINTKFDRVIEALDRDFKLSDLLVTGLFSKLHSIMPILVNMYGNQSQEKPLNRSVKLSHLKRQRCIAWHNYKDIH